MDEPRLTPLTTCVEPDRARDDLVAQIVDLVEKVTGCANGAALDARGCIVVCIVLPQPLTSTAAVKEGRSALPRTALAGRGERVDLERFTWAFEERKNMRTLKRFFLMGWAYRNGARSLRDVLRKLKPHRQGLGAENVPASTRDYSDCAKEVTNRFRRFFSTERAGEVELFVRKGEKPAFIDLAHQDTRPIIGLTEAGWQAWVETGRFLGAHGGPGPWAVIDGEP